MIIKNVKNLKEGTTVVKENWKNILDNNFGFDVDKILEFSSKIRNKESAISIINAMIDTFYKVEFTLEIRNTKLGCYKENWGDAILTYLNLIDSYPIIQELEDNINIEFIEGEYGASDELKIYIEEKADVLDLWTFKYYLAGELD